MGSLGKAYIWSILFTLTSTYASSLVRLQFWSKILPFPTVPGNIPYPNIVLIASLLLHITIVGHYISKDAVSKGKSKNHQLWAWLGIVGLSIYSAGFAGGGNKPEPQQQYGEPHNNHYEQRYSETQPPHQQQVQPQQPTQQYPQQQPQQGYQQQPKQ